ncbi:MlaD family protein [Gordonia sp. CPCC 206044]|uniref:MlaD family protein n=1 Tax=Gordonia sp. CPCC 206044 TaxID=3140793 RepID=UPI003AF35965
MLSVRRFLLSRSTITTIVVILIAAVAVSGYRFTVSGSGVRSYCALMPDSIGLYVNNQVTVLGMPIGKVTSITPEGTRTRVDFEIDANRRLPTDVGATTLSRTLMADRELSLVGNEPAAGSPSWDAGKCITKSVTPKSISKTLAAFSKLSDELNGYPQAKDLSRALTQLDNATSGTGDDINRIILGLGRALNSPDAAIGHLGDILTDLSALSESVAGGWADIKSLLTRFPPTITRVNQAIIGPSVDIIARLRQVMPMFNDITTMFGGRLLRSLDANQNLPQMLSAQIGSLGEAIDMIPVFTGAFRRIADPRTGGLALTYSAPAVPLPAGVGSQVCRALGKSGPDCGRQTSLSSLVPAILGSEEP